MTATSRLVLVLQGFAIAALLTIALDLYAHKRVEQLGGVNIWGYRGPVMRQKQPNEIRLAVAGGDLAFGWGVAASETVAPTVRQLVALALDRPGQTLRLITAVNLGALGLPQPQYASRLLQFAYLAPDVICLYLDPHDRAAGSVLPAFDSELTALTGYVPMLPLVLEEKGWTAVGRGLRGMDRMLYRLGRHTPAAGSDAGDALASAVGQALDIASRAVVVIPPATTPVEREAHLEWRDAMTLRWGADARLRTVDLGADPVLYDPALRLGGINFSTAGHARAAAHIAPAVLELLNQSDRP